MKIAITHTRFSSMGGIEKYIYSLVERLLKAGHEVHYLTARWEPYEHPNLHFHRVPWIRFPPSLRVLSFNYFVNRILRQHSFDLVHGFTKTDTQDIYTDGSGCLLDFVTATQSHHSSFRRFLYLMTPHQRAILRMERRRFRRNAILRIIPMARFVRQQILQRYDVDPERIEVVHNGVELVRFHPNNRNSYGRDFRTAHGLSPDQPLLLFVGNDWQRKGLDVLLRSLPKILRHCPAKLLVAGHDNHPSRYLQLAQSLSIASHVIWLGPVKEIQKPFAAADVFVFPSRYDAFGNAGLEALASGLPSVLSSKAGVSEVIDESSGGRVLNAPQDPDELADAALYFLMSPNKEECRRDARAIAEKYSWDRHFERIIAIYYEVLEEKRRLQDEGALL